MGKQPIVNCSAVFDDQLGSVEYQLNGVRVTREDFIAIQLSRIAGALEDDLVDDDEGDDSGEDGGDLFGLGPKK